MIGHERKGLRLYSLGLAETCQQLNLTAENVSDDMSIPVQCRPHGCNCPDV